MSNTLLTSRQVFIQPSRLCLQRQNSKLDCSVPNKYTNTDTRLCYCIYYWRKKNETIFIYLTKLFILVIIISESSTTFINFNKCNIYVYKIIFLFVFYSKIIGFPSHSLIGNVILTFWRRITPYCVVDNSNILRISLFILCQGNISSKLYEYIFKA